MSNPNQNFSLYRGESKTIFCELNQADGSDFNTAGSNMEWWLAKTWHSLEYDDGVILKKSLGGGLTVVTGGVDISLAANETMVDPGLYYHELKLFLPGGGVSSAMLGTAVIHPAFDMRPRPSIETGSASVSGSGTVT